jgi:hypothetical protein
MTAKNKEALRHAKEKGPEVKEAAEEARKKMQGLLKRDPAVCLTPTEGQLGFPARSQ